MSRRATAAAPQLVPWQQVIEWRQRMLGDAGEHIGEPGLLVNVANHSLEDQAAYGGSTLATAIGAGEQPRIPPKRYVPWGALNGIL